YVANQSDGFTDGSVTVIDGVTNATTTIPAGRGVKAIAVNTRTNTIYAANTFENSVMVIDGATNNVTTFSTASFPFDIVVKAVTNTVYISLNNSSVLVIDGATNTVTATVSVG